MTALERRVHVIMPIGSDPHSQARKAAIARGSEQANFIAMFPEYEFHDPAFSLDDLKKELRAADLVIADLSLERPSCYYELGVAEALGKQVLLVAMNGTSIHQSSSRSLVRFYPDL